MGREKEGNSKCDKRGLYPTLVREDKGRTNMKVILTCTKSMLTFVNHSTYRLKPDIRVRIPRREGRCETGPIAVVYNGATWMVRRVGGRGRKERKGGLHPPSDREDGADGRRQT